MSSDDSIDHDTQLAILATVLEPATYPISELAQALRDSKGDVAAAAEALLLPRLKSAGKRKAGTSLESWLGKKRGGDGVEVAGAKARQGVGKGKEDNSDIRISGGARTGMISGNGEVAGAEVRQWVGKGKEDKLDNGVNGDSGTRIAPKDPYDGVSSISNALPPPLLSPSPEPLKPSPSPAPLPPSKAKNAFHLLQSSPTPPKRKATPMPAVTLATQSAIDAHHLPLTLLKSPLSPALASALFLALMEESEEWGRHRWFLAGRWVESPHTSANYYRLRGGYGELESEDGRHEEPEGGGNGADGGEGAGSHAGKAASGTSEDRQEHGKGSRGENQRGRYYYSGSELFPPKPYPDLLRQAAELIEPVVNRSLQAHARHLLEWAGEWRANVCGANRYDGAAIGVGWHADQLSYLGPAATICSLSLGTTRAFRVRQTEAIDASSTSVPSSATAKPIRTYEVDLAHNSLILMNAGCQERFKHTIPPQKALDLFRPTFDIHQSPIAPTDQKTYTARINITFRFYRQDFHPSPADGWRGWREGTPYCKCGIPTLLRADQKAKARANMTPHPIPRTQQTEQPEQAERVAGHSSNATLAPDSLSAWRIMASTWLARHEPTYNLDQALSGSTVKPDDMVYFWQCQSPGNTGELKGCGFFKILDMGGEGRGPCWGDVMQPGSGDG